MASRMLYVLELEPGEDENARWYVGLTDDPKRRFKQHLKGEASEWTRRNRPIHGHIIGENRFYFGMDMENQLTLALWDEYGPGSTRGGSYCQPEKAYSEPPQDADTGLSPELAKMLRETEVEGLVELAEREVVYIDLFDKLEFGSVGEAKEWINEHLPTGTDARATTAGPGESRWTSKDPDEENSEQFFSGR